MDQNQKISVDVLSRPISEVTFTAFDIETTGLNPHMDAIIEIGAVRFRQHKQLDTFETLIDPGANVHNSGVEINHITPEMLHGQPQIAAALTDFSTFVGDTVLVGHNIQNFDLPFVRNQLARLSFAPLYNHIVDTLILARKIFPRATHYSLRELAQSFSITQNNAHRALDDAITCSKLFHRITEEVAFMGDTPPLNELIG